ncbi:hypothetical protein [Wolbachia endosymbiont of Litomosoides brasiliensis]|nr:hypothetical protein [Wolbachia endosymbiont of Litomosoides brasiliensis]
MALKSKLLDKKVVESAKEVRNNTHATKKTKCYNCRKKSTV